MIRNVVPPHIGFAFRRYAMLVREGLVCDDPDATREAFHEAGMQIVLDLIDAYEPGMDPYEFCSDFLDDEIPANSKARELCSLLKIDERDAEIRARHLFKVGRRTRAKSHAKKLDAHARDGVATDAQAVHSDGGSP